MNRTISILPACLLALTSTGFADLPATLHTQGRIVVSNVNFTGPGQFKFLLFTDSDANHANGNETALWKNDSAAPADLNEPAGAVSTVVTNGLYSAQLGDAPQAALPSSLVPPAGETLYLRTWFDDGVNGSQQLAPDQLFSAVPFARHADITGLNISSLVNDANYLTEESFDFTVESDSAEFSEAQLGGSSGSFSTSFSFSETFADPPMVSLNNSVGITNPVVSNVSTTGFDLDFDYAVTVGSSPVPVAQPWSNFSLMSLGGKPAVIVPNGAPLISTASSTITLPGQGSVTILIDQIDAFPVLEFHAAQDSATTWDAPIPLGSVLAAEPTNPAFPPNLFKTFDGAMIGGSPAVAFLEATPLQFASASPTELGFTGQLKLTYRRATNPAGSAWGSPIEVEFLADAAVDFNTYAANSSPSGIDLEEIGGIPTILQQSTLGVFLHRATDPSGTAWNRTDISAQLPAAGSTTLSNLLDLGGNPAFGYMTTLTPATPDDPFLAVVLLTASDPAGTTWNPPHMIWSVSQNEALAGGATVGTSTSFALELFNLDGHPALAFSSSYTSTLGAHFVRAGDAAGSTWPAATKIATHGPSFPDPADTIGAVAATSFGGLPVVGFKRGEELLSVTANDTNGTTWSAEQSLATGFAGNIAATAGAATPIFAASDFLSIPPPGALETNVNGDIQQFFGYFLPPEGGSLSVVGTRLPFVAWTADDPADVDLQQQLLSLDGTDLSISAGNTIDLSGLQITDHGALTGLLDDDHPQYFLGNGSEPFGGNLDLDGNNLLNAGAVGTTNLAVTGSLSVTGSLFLPNTSISNLALQSSVMIQNENVSLLTNDAGYLDSLAGLPVSDLLNDAGYIPDLGDATLTGNLTVTGTLSTGLDTTASGTRSTAFGHDSESTGLNSMTWGFSGLASGTSTTAWGSGTTASAARATAFGVGSSATGLNSTSWGESTTAGGINTTAFGNGSTASGNISTAFGRGTTAESFAETTLGRFDTDYTPNSAIAWNTADRLFVIGKGSGDANRADALVMLKNGNTTLNGDLSLNGSADLNDDVDIDGNVGIVAAPRADAQLTLQATPTAPHNLVLVNSGESSALAYWSLFTQDKDTNNTNNSNNLFLQFSGDGTTFTSRGMFDKVSGAYTSLSDRKHKKNVEGLEETLPKISELPLHRFHFNGQQDEDPKEVGVIAQELREVYPSLVSEAADTLTVNYSALGVIALKAIQEQQALIEKQQAAIDALLGRLERLESAK